MADDKALAEEFSSLSQEFENYQKIHKSYLETRNKVFSLQAKCSKELVHQKYRLAAISKDLKSCKSEDVSEQTSFTIRVGNLGRRIKKRYEDLKDISNSLPKKNSGYLQTHLGSVNLAILSPKEKYEYKDNYEKFKLTIHAIAMLLSIVNFIVDSDFLNILFKFLLVWYYCTLTLRESILKLNGSRMKGWWRFHHFVFVTLSGLFLLWPEHDPVYVNHFRSNLHFFSVYMSLLQFLQFRYQEGCLYRLRALGQSQTMDITIEGFHSWMWRGLGFLLPFHIILYLFELHNASLLWSLWLNHPEATWHVPVISALFFLIFFGNFITLVLAIPRKFRERMNWSGKFAVAVNKMKSSSSASLSIATQKLRKISSAASSAVLSNVIPTEFNNIQISDGPQNASVEIANVDDTNNNNNDDQGLVFVIDSNMMDQAKDNTNSFRYPLKKFLSLSHRTM